MELKGDYTFDAPQDLVWEAVQDPQVLGSVMPGGKGFEEVGDNEYAGSLTVKVGPVQGAFDAQIKLMDVVAPESYSIQVDAKGAPGFVKATGELKLEGRDEQTYMEYAGNAQIGGRIASVGQRLMDSTAKSIVRQSLEGLNEHLKVQVAHRQATESTETVAEDSVDNATETTTSSVPEVPTSQYKPPSQTQVALTVARDVFDDMVPSQYQPFVILGIVGIIGLIIWLLFS